MHQYRFTLDGNEVEPVSLDGFSRILDISDGRVRRVEYSGTLQFKDEAYDTLKGAYFATTLNGLCTPYEMTIEYRENPHDSWTNFGNAVIDDGSVVLDFESKTISFSLNPNDNISAIDENGRTEVVVDQSNGTLLTMFEYESGTQYTDQVRFYKVADVIDELFAKMGTGSTLTSTIFTTAYQPRIETVTTVALNAGDQLIYKVGFFSEEVINLIINIPAGGYTAIEVAEVLEKALQYNLHTNEITALKVVHNVCVTRASNVLTITSPWGELATEISVNAIDVTGTYLVETQAYQFGLKNLYISAKGMRNTDLSISFDQLWSFLWRQFNLGMAALSLTSIQIDDLYDMVIGTTPATVGFSDVLKFTRKLNPDKLLNGALIGSKFKVSAYDKSQTDWEWADDTDSHIYVGVATDYALPAGGSSKYLTFDDETNVDEGFVDAGGRWDGNTYTASKSINVIFNVSLWVKAGNTASQLTNSIDVELNGVQDYVYDVDANEGALPTATGTALNINFETPIFCLNNGDTIAFNWQNTTATSGNLDVTVFIGRTTPTTLTTNIQPSCETAPEVNEEEYEITALELGDGTSACKKNLDLQTDQSIYSGLGYAISQHIQGLQDYENTYFVVMKKEGLDEAEAFETCYYYPSDPNCDCQDDNFFSKFFYNIPIQFPLIANQVQRVFATKFEWALYQRDITFVDPNFIMIENVEKLDNPTVNLKDVGIIEFEECLKPSELKTVESEFTVGFDRGDLPFDFKYNERYRKIEFELATGVTRFELSEQRF